MRIPLLHDVFLMVKPGRPLLPNQALFHVPKHYAKPQIKHYLQRLYGVDVERIETVLAQGKKRMVRTRTMLHEYKQPNYKKAYVTFKGVFYND
jgi:ribosomal protein L23